MNIVGMSAGDWERITRENHARHPTCKRESCLGCSGLDVCDREELTSLRAQRDALLTACKTALAHFHANNGSVTAIAMIQIRDAILKAEGK